MIESSLKNSETAHFGENEFASDRSNSFDTALAGRIQFAS